MVRWSGEKARMILYVVSTVMKLMKTRGSAHADFYVQSNLYSKLTVMTLVCSIRLPLYRHHSTVVCGLSGTIGEAF